MISLSQQILEHATRQPEGTPLLARALLHLGKRAAIDQALSRLQRRGQLLRVARGIYVLPVQTRFGSHAPGVARIIEGLARQRGETIVPHGAAAANTLGLTPQVPTRAIYLTSGPDRQLQLGRQTVELRHAPAWQLLFPGQPAGDAVRALAWSGPEEAPQSLEELRSRLSGPAQEALAQARAQLPVWLAQAISSHLAAA